MDTITRHDRPGAPFDDRYAPNGPLIAGPRWYRTRIRVWGPLLGVLPMAVLGAIAWTSLQVGDGRRSGMLGLVAGVSAAPGLLFAGAPFSDNARYPMAVLASVPLWLVLGLLASRRATRTNIASWRDYWREMTLLTIAVIAGGIAALVAATTILGESLVV